MREKQTDMVKTHERFWFESLHLVDLNDGLRCDSFI